MKSYKKVAYVGAIWSLLQYNLFIITALYSSSMISQVKPIVDMKLDYTLNFVTSMVPLLFLFGIAGIMTCIVIIFSLKKIKKADLIRKKLSKILIITGIVLFVLQIIQFPIMVNGMDEAIRSTPQYNGWYTGSYTDVLDSEKTTGIVVSVIPSIILVISGILAMKFNENQKLNI